MCFSPERPRDWLVADWSGRGQETKSSILSGRIHSFVLAFVAAEEDEIAEREKTRGSKGKVISRERGHVTNMFRQLGKSYCRRAYRMTPRSFLHLHRTLKPGIDKIFPTPRKCSINGPIHSSFRLSSALRFFAGGAVYDIVLTHGMGHSTVYDSIWGVVDAVNKCDTLKIAFPDHEGHKEVAAGFATMSRADFCVCVGAVDGMLIWTRKPFEGECREMKCGDKMLYCERKSKFGLNFQARCDHRGKFTWISIKYVGSTSDYLAWSTSDLPEKLSVPDVLLSGHTLFGDSAYCKEPYTATPINGAKGGYKDAYNYYHSQLRIKN